MCLKDDKGAKKIHFLGFVKSNKFQVSASECPPSV